MGNCTQCTVKEVKNDRDDVISSAQREKIKHLNVNDYSKELFNALNNIRANMKKYGMLLEKIASSTKESNEINISGIELTDEDKKLVKHFLQYLQSHEDKVNIIKEISNFLLNQSSKTIEWNQKIYEIISSYANKNELYKEIPQELRIDINKAVDKNVSETIFSYTKYFEAYNMVWHLLIDNKEQIDSMLLDEYEVGCCVTIKTILYLYNFIKNE